MSLCPDLWNQNMRIKIGEIALYKILKVTAYNGA